MMGGWKTWAGVISGACAGISMIVMSVTGQGDGSVYEGILVLIAAWTALGIGDKVEKARK